jgi:crotonobetainyl-CoA:carnitine CoA-transferase CaiB-like acyl-CoA transferase
MVHPPSGSIVLQGTNVVRWGRSRSGDFLTRILRDHGARVDVCSERSSGDLEHKLANARVVIEDVGRGARLPAALNFAALARANPRLVYCRLVSFPEGAPLLGPELEDEPVLAALGLNRLASGPPRAEPLPVASFCAGVVGGLHTACALLPHIAKSGPQLIEVSLFEATLNMVGRSLVTVKDPRWFDPSRQFARLPVAELYECADGRWVQPHGMYPHFVDILCRVGGHPEWAEEPAAKVERLRDASAIPLWRERLTKLFKERTAAEWEQAINAANGSCTICRHHEEWMVEPHARQSKMFVYDSDRQQWRAGAGVMVTPNEATIEPGRTKHVRPRKEEDGKPLPLAGVRVIDFCIVIAGPTCGRLLADLGADVVKVEAPNREIAPYLWLDVNRGKRSIVVDLTSEEGRQIAADLIADADVVTENFRNGKFAALGFGHSELAARRPDLVYASMTALDHQGPWEKFAGWEHNGQAASGMQWARSSDAEPEQVPFPVNDFATGMLAALGVVLALLHRELTGQGSLVRASLARSATFVQWEAFEPDCALPRNPTLNFQCSDGWVSAFATPEAKAAVGEVPQSCSCQQLIAMLSARGIQPWIESRTSDLISNADWLIARGSLVRWQHPSLGEMVQATPRAQASAFATAQGFPAPDLGAHTEEILREIGRTPEQIEQLVAAGIVVKNHHLFDPAPKPHQATSPTDAKGQQPSRHAP